MGANSSTPTPTEKIEGPLQIVNNSGVTIKAKSDTMHSIYIDNQKTGTLFLPRYVKFITIEYPGSGGSEKISLRDLLSGGLNPVIYIKPSVQILSSDSLLPERKSDSPAAIKLSETLSSGELTTPTGYVPRPTVNATMV